MTVVEATNPYTQALCYYAEIIARARPYKECKVIPNINGTETYQVNTFTYNIDGTLKQSTDNIILLGYA
jgi:hypothetical protein